MQNGYRQSTKTRQQTSLKVDPKVVLGSQLLQMSQIELEQAIRTELMENPALERYDEYDEPITREEIIDSVAPRELKTRSKEDYENLRSLPTDDKGLDWMEMTASTDSLWDHLLAQLKTTVPQEHWDLVTYFVGSINERGYLTCTLEDAALDSNAMLEDAQIVLDELRMCEPAGVGAFDLRDCLYLQLRHAESDAQRLARSMIKRHWDELVNRNKTAIMKLYKADEEIVEMAFEEILCLNPFPGEFYCRSENSASEKVVQVQPDVVITMDQSGFIVEIPGPSPIHLKVSHSYLNKKDKLDEGWNTDPAEKRHVNEFVNRAQRFLDALGQRRQQLARLGKYLIENQSGFVKTGEYQFLRPLTRSQIARDLGVHESTISRATAGKFVQIVTGDLVSFDVFFKPALRVQKMIEEILETENPDSPFSDERIAQLLEDRGVSVARRTVNKYRDRSKQLSSRKRRAS